MVAEEQAIAKAAVKDLKLDIAAPAEGELYDIKEVTEAVDELVNTREQAVRESTETTVIGQDEEINDESIAFANQILADLETVAQKQVDALKVKDAATVNLQQKVLDYNNTAKEINVNVIEFNSAMGVLSTNNDGTSTVGGAGTITASGFDSAEDFKVSVDVWKAGGAQGTVELSFDKNGELVVEGFAAKDDDLDAIIEARKELAAAEGDLTDAEIALETAKANNELAAAITDAADAVNTDGLLDDGAWNPTTEADVVKQLQDLVALLEEAELGATDGEVAALKDLYNADEGKLTGDAEADSVTAITGAVAGAKALAPAVTDEAALGVLETAVTSAQTDVEAKQEALDDLLTSSDDVEDLFNNLEGVDDFIASVEALYGNIAAQAAAAAAVDAAILNSLKKAGYKVYDSDAKVVSWSNVKVKDGKLVKADEKEIKTFVLEALDSEGNPLTYGKDKTAYDSVAIGDELVKLPGIKAADGKIDGSANVKLPDMPNVITDSAEASEDALDKLDTAQQEIADFNKAVDAYNAAVETEKALEAVAADVKAAAEAVAEAESAFEELGFNLVKAVDGVANGTAFDENAEDQDADLFVYGESKLTVENFDGNDVLYFGDKAADLIVVTKAQADSAAGKLGGEANVLDIFAYQDGANTILFVESEAFAGNASGAAANNPDLVEVTLTGVNVADLSFEDGFLALA